MSKQLNLFQKIIAPPVLLLIVVACGNKGKLYLPDAQSYGSENYTMQADDLKALDQKHDEDGLNWQI